MKHGKKYNESIKKYDREKDFDPAAACGLKAWLRSRKSLRG